jgi:hypothetical protein
VSARTGRKLKFVVLKKNDLNQQTSTELKKKVEFPAGYGMGGEGERVLAWCRLLSKMRRKERKREEKEERKGRRETI